ncbi:MAG: peptide ABC transporter substrate-binding protein [Candidatus Treponema excrementipullorum]|uniref:Peptide ABC transporter substrate-binding protein n=1 Tax=Candidatus Treponema excrementipullorum TaxID=2838768 RepID=A0A9E2L3M5_9SPIR|nr:peptide ABC transporter substrate-binding protein [Candidatus Treponema excrementipullorum]
MKTTNKVFTCVVFALLAFSLVFVGCSKKEEVTVANNAQQTATKSFDLNVCVASEPQTIDPALNSAVDGAIMTQHFFEGLMKWADSGKPVNDKGNMNFAELVNGQASSYQKVVNDDGTVTYTFKIRPDAKWSDGKAVTANDFVYSWRRLADPNTAADYCYMIDMVKGYAEVNSGEADPSTLAVSAPDASTFEVVLTYDCPYFLEICAFPAAFPVREDVVSAEPDTWTTSNGSKNYITNGPWKMAEWVHDSYIKMVPNEYHYDVANLGPDSITFRLMADSNAMLAGFRSNDLQYINQVPVDETPSLIASGELDIVDYIGTYYVSYQTQAEPFDDWRVRKAFTLTIDSKYIVEQITQSGQVPATGFVPAGVYDANPTGDDFRTVGGDYWEAPLTDEIYQKNCEEARQLLADAGYPNGEGFPVVTYLYNTGDAHKAIGEALQQMWQKALNVTVQLQNQEWNAFLETRKNGDFQVARNGWIADYNDPISFLDMWLTGGGNNDGQYSNPEYDAAIKEAKSSADPAVRMAAMHRAEDIIMGEDWALGPIYFYTNSYMMKENIKGAFYTPLGYYIFGYTYQN